MTTIAFRVVGETAVTLGVVLLLFFVWTTWWTNIAGDAHARERARRLEERWEDAGPGAAPPETFAPNAGFALLYLPKIGVKVPVAEGTDKRRVLDKGLVGHYTTPRTAMPWDPRGNVGLAAHRDTHGEPFHNLDRLVTGDVAVMETERGWFTYRVEGVLPRTSPANVKVLDAVPGGGPFTGPGRYLTLTTCTPKGSSAYRLIVWARLVEERPRAQGRPPALTARTG